MRRLYYFAITEDYSARGYCDTADEALEQCAWASAPMFEGEVTALIYSSTRPGRITWDGRGGFFDEAGKPATFVDRRTFTAPGMIYPNT